MHEAALCFLVQCNGLQILIRSVHAPCNGLDSVILWNWRCLRKFSSLCPPQRRNEKYSCEMEDFLRSKEISMLLLSKFHSCVVCIQNIISPSYCKRTFEKNVP
jgi:hypothetical protein